MLYHCIIRSCNSTASRSTKDLTFHRIPSDCKRRKEWLETCNRTDLIDKSLEFLKRKYVCSKHFEKCMYGVRFLQRFASPTLNLGPSLRDSCTQTYISIKCLDPTPSTNELPGPPVLKRIGLEKSHTETEEFVCRADYYLEGRNENDNPNTQIEVQSDELEPKVEKELETNENLQIFTDINQESEEDTPEMSIDEFLHQNSGLEEEIRKELEEQNIPQIPINETNTRSNLLFEINKETQTDDVAVFIMPKNNVCFQQCLRCGKNANWRPLKSPKPKKRKPDHLITLDDFKRACDKFLKPSFCAIIKSHIQLQQFLVNQNSGVGTIYIYK